MIIISCLSCLTRVSLNRRLCKVHVQVRYILTCRKKIIACSGGFHGTGPQGDLRPGRMALRCLSFRNKIIFSHVIMNSTSSKLHQCITINIEGLMHWLAARNKLKDPWKQLINFTSVDVLWGYYWFVISG